jgi:hypothetical protein
MLHLWMDLLLEHQDTFAFVELLYLADFVVHSHLRNMDLDIQKHRMPNAMFIAS